MRSPLLLVSVAALGCDPGVDRDATLRSTFVRADAAILAQRPELVASRYAAMAQSAHAFYRGALAVYLRDWRDGETGLSFSRFAVDAPMPLGVGDPHVENFGSLLGRDGVLALEANDLDGADRVPYLWDLRRLTVGLCVAAADSNGGDPDALARATAASRGIAREAALAYAAAIQPGAPERRVTEGGDAPVLVDLFRRARRDAASRAELGELTVTVNGARRLRRGIVDPQPPASALSELPPWAYDTIPALFARYRESLTAPPDPRFFTVLDAARQFGGGVASLPRVRVLVLVRGPSDALDDDVLVEIKEQSDALTPGGPPPGVYADDIPSRVAAARRTVWSLPDAEPLWGTSTWFGLPVQIRHESEAHKGVKVDRLRGDAGTPEAMRALARVLGGVLARAHRRSLPSPAPQAAMLSRAPAAFADEEADLALRYAAQVLDDFARFQRLLRAHGPTLGRRHNESDAPSSPARALFGSPP